MIMQRSVYFYPGFEEWVLNEAEKEEKSFSKKLKDIIQVYSNLDHEIIKNIIKQSLGIDVTNLKSENFIPVDWPKGINAKARRNPTDRNTDQILDDVTKKEKK